jgi:protein phosphatase
MSFEKMEVFGNTPLPRFGHSITFYAENKVCLFGGATGNTGQFSITDNTYTLDLNTKFWRKV